MHMDLFAKILFDWTPKLGEGMKNTLKIRQEANIGRDQDHRCTSEHMNLISSLHAMNNWEKKQLKSALDEEFTPQLFAVSYARLAAKR